MNIARLLWIFRIPSFFLPYICLFLLNYFLSVFLLCVCRKLMLLYMYCAFYVSSRRDGLSFPPKKTDVESWKLAMFSIREVYSDLYRLYGRKFAMLFLKETHWRGRKLYCVVVWKDWGLRSQRVRGKNRKDVQFYFYMYEICASLQITFLSQVVDMVVELSWIRQVFRKFLRNRN